MAPPNYHRRVSNDIELSLQLHQLRDLSGLLGLFVQDDGGGSKAVNLNEEWIDEEYGLLLDGSGRRRRSSTLTSSNSTTTASLPEEYYVPPLTSSYNDVPLLVAYNRRRMMQPRYHSYAPSQSSSTRSFHPSSSRTPSTTKSIPPLANVIECSKLLDESNRSRSSAISWSSSNNNIGTIRLTNRSTDPTVGSCEGDDSRCDCDSGGGGGNSITTRRQQSMSLISLSRSLRSSIRRTSRRRKQSQISSHGPSVKNQYGKTNMPAPTTSGQSSSLPSYDFLQKEGEAKECDASIRPITKWWHGVFIISLISMLASIITLWAPFPIGARMPSATIATMPFSNGCIALQSCICPRATICADDLLSMIFLTIARSTAWFNYPLYMLLFLSKANNLNDFLQKTALRCWINFSDFHRVHTLFGIVVGLESASHSFFHILRWARRKNDIQVMKKLFKLALKTVCHYDSLTINCSLSSLVATMDDYNWRHRIDCHHNYSHHRLAHDSAISQKTNLLRMA